MTTTLVNDIQHDVTARLSKAAKAKTKVATKCNCGCGGKTKGGRFIPGHDSKLKGVLKAAVADGSITAAQKELIRSLGWEVLVGLKEGKGNLSVPQINILRVLKKNPTGLTRAGIESEVGLSINMTAELGPTHKEDVAKYESRFNRKSLIGLRAVTCERDENQIIYKINKNGEKAIAK